MEQPEVTPSRQSSLDPVSIHDSSSLKKPRGGKPKLFQCTGYGECRMVFTRSEHLARHMRKHTGEKPFKCVVPECNRMFSRFDNMMQHTQTHNKARSTSRGPKNGSTGKSKGKRSSEASLSDEDSCYDHSGLPSPPPSRRGTKNKDLYRARIRQQRQLQRKNYAEDYEEEDRDDDDDDDDDEDDDDDMEGLGYGDSDESDSDASYSMYGYHHNSAIADQREMFAEMRRSSHDGYTLPLPVPYSQQHPSLPWPAMPKSVLNHDPIWSLPSIHAPIPLIPSGSRTSQRPHRRHRLSESPLSFSSGSTTDASPCKRQRTTPKVQFHPYPYNGSSHRRHSTDNGQTLRPLYHPKKSGDRSTPIDEDDRHMILPRIATYLVAHPDEPPENYLLHHQQRSPLYQKRAMTWPTLPGTEKVITRRLSVQDLCNPIECLEHSDGNMALPTPVKQEEEDGVDLTLDEYEAIQGFGRFQKCGLLGLE